MVPRAVAFLCAWSCYVGDAVGPKNASTKDASIELVAVMHSGHPDRVAYTNAARQSWLLDVDRYVVIDGVRAPTTDGKRRRLSGIHVYYDDNPGCYSARPDNGTYKCEGGEALKFHMIGKYFGAHRTLAGLLVANDTWPDAEWVLVADDDNDVDVSKVRRYLAQLDSSVPLLLAGRVGPGRNTVPCRSTSDGDKWSCCTDASLPCRAQLYGPQAVWEYNKTVRSFVPNVCPEHESSNYCCRTKPDPAGITSGFPYRVDPHGDYRPHFSLLWPYGGAGYVLSRGLLDAIPRQHWEHCMYGFQCANADHRVMACVLNAGYSLTMKGNMIPGILHHVKPGSRSRSPHSKRRDRGGTP